VKIFREIHVITNINTVYNELAHVQVFFKNHAGVAVTSSYSQMGFE
jgi:hypothetical protein